MLCDFAGVRLHLAVATLPSDKAEFLQEFSIRVNTALPERKSVTGHLYPGVNSPPLFEIAPEPFQGKPGPRCMQCWVLQERKALLLRMLPL